MADIRTDMADLADIDGQYCRYWHKKLLAGTDMDTEILNHVKGFTI